MKFEQIPNEIILHLFEYLSVTHLFSAFYHVNLRFNRLLCQQFQKFHLDFRSLSKTSINHICQNYLSSISERTVSLYLSNDDDTPHQIELFLCQSIQLRQFNRLQSVFISHVGSYKILDRIMGECSYLPHLKHLTITEKQLALDEHDAKRLFNHLWSLPELTYCYLGIDFVYDSYFSNPGTVCTSLRHLVIPFTRCSLPTVARIYQYTPNLEYLSINFYNDASDLEVSAPFLSITRLKIISYDDIDNFKYLLQNLPNLNHLTFEADEFYFNGYEWEEIITIYLPQLRIFRFKVEFSSYHNQEEKAQLNRLLESFRTKFWIEEHQWFVQYHWYTRHHLSLSDQIILFTLPYTFDGMHPTGNYIVAKSTCPYENEYLTWNHVKDLHYNSIFFADSPLSNIHFPTVEKLSLIIPFTNEFFSVVTNLDQLTRLVIHADKTTNFDMIELQLQTLLDRAPHLYSLGLTHSSQLSLINLASTSVRQLDLHNIDTNDSLCYYDDKQCNQLICSPLVMQCQTLTIAVKNRQTIVNLVSNLTNLQVLIVDLKNDTWESEEFSALPERDASCEWLHKNLPSACTITRDTYYAFIRLWIR